MLPTSPHRPLKNFQDTLRSQARLFYSDDMKINAHYVQDLTGKLDPNDIQESLSLLFSTRGAASAVASQALVLRLLRVLSPSPLLSSNSNTTPKPRFHRNRRPARPYLVGVMQQKQTLKKCSFSLSKNKW